MDTEPIDNIRKTKAREYAKVKRRLYFLELGLTAAYLVLWLASGLSVAVRTAFQIPFPLQIGAYVVLFIAGHTLATFPLSFYSDHYLPRKYGLSVQSTSSWLGDVAKSFTLSILILILAVEVLYWLISLTPTLWWLPAGLFFLFFTVVLASLGPILIVPLFYSLTPLADENLANRLKTLVERAGTKVGGVFTMQMSSKTTTANAALMGLGNTRRIVLADTLLDRYSVAEVESVLAHELGHHVRRDITKGIVMESLATMVGFYVSSALLLKSVDLFGFAGVSDIAALPLLAIIMGSFMFILRPASNAYSRWAERAADRYSLEMTNDPMAFETLMLKLADQNLSEPNPQRWVEIMFYDHPPFEKRVSMARRFAKEKGRLS